MRSGGGSMARIGLHVGEDWWAFLSTYDDHSPILDIAAGSTTVTVCFDGTRLGASALEFARELAGQAASSPPRSNGCTPGHSHAGGRAYQVAGTVRPLDGDHGWGGRNGHSCRPGCLPLLAQMERRRV